MNPSSRKRWISLVIGVLLIVGAFGAVWIIQATEPTATRVEATRESAMPVRVAAVEQGTYRPGIEVLGTVRAAREVSLTPRVAGMVIEMNEALTPGGTVTRGEMLVRIDPADYEIALARAQSDLHQAEADLAVEEGRRAVAEQDYALLGDAVAVTNRSLLLREPQLNQARARVEAARAAVRQAELDLERTTVRAPFDAHILWRDVEVGAQVSPSTEIAHLVADETYWIETTVPQALVRWIAFPGEDEAGSASVLVRHPAAWPDDAVRTGTVFRRIGALDETTRMVRVLVEVRDPMALGDAAGQPPLLLGAVVQASIDARPLEDVFRLDRDHVHARDTVWVMEDNRLAIREVEVVFRDARWAYVRDGLRDGDLVVISHLASVVPGAALQLAEDGAGDGVMP